MWTLPTTSSRLSPRATGARVCPDAASSSNASLQGVDASSTNTSPRGSRISPSVRSAISNAPSMIIRCCGVNVSWAATMSRNSSSVTSSRCWCGSAPARRTTRSVEWDNSQTIGRVSVDNMARGRAMASPHRSARCMAIRLGASSPKTSVRYDRMSVTMMIDVGPAAPPRKLSGASSGSASETAAAAEARKPARVMPIWMVARNWFGARASRARSAPVADRSSIRWSCPSRSETSASSVPANAAFKAIRTTTRMI